MTQRNALMELIEQSRRLAKQSDMLVLNKIDYLFKYIWLIEPKKLKDYRHLLEPIIEYYHKPNIFEIIKSKAGIEEYFKKHYSGETIQDYINQIINSKTEYCVAKTDYTQCKLCQFLRECLMDVFEACLNNYKKEKESLDILVCEIVDFMHERPELVNLNLIDDYIRSLVDEVCTRKNKINPLNSDLVMRFGKYWKDKQGNWHEEKRKRF